MDDLISRQAAINAIENTDCELSTDAWNELTDAIMSLPSAQPEKKVFGNMSDEEFEKWLYEHGICHPDIHEPIPCDVVPLPIDDAISELPSAQRKGKWKYEKMKHILNGEVRTVRICSECNGGWFRYDLSDGVEDVEPNYCPNCGAEMKGEEDVRKSD